MKKLNKQAIIRQAERLLKRTEDYQYRKSSGYDENYKIQLVLAKENTFDMKDIIAFAQCEDMMMKLKPYSNEVTMIDIRWIEIDNICDYLSSGYKIVDMSLDFHWCAWADIDEYGIEDISQDGLQKYLKYCKQHGITKAKLQEQADYTGEDIMKYHQTEKHHSEPER